MIESSLPVILLDVHRIQIPPLLSKPDFYERRDRPDSMKESQEHQAFCKWLDMNQIPFVHSRTDRKHTNAVGDCDFYCFLAGRVIGLEMKVGRNKLSPKQEKRHAYLRRAGNVVRIVQDCAQAILAVQSHFGVENAVQPIPEQRCGISGARLDQPEAGTSDELRMRIILGEPEPETESANSATQKKTEDEPAPNLFVADFGGRPCVFKSGPHPKQLYSATLVRTATPYDLLHIPRR